MEDINKKPFYIISDLILLTSFLLIFIYFQKFLFIAGGSFIIFILIVLIFIFVGIFAELRTQSLCLTSISICVVLLNCVSYFETNLIISINIIIPTLVLIYSLIFFCMMVIVKNTFKSNLTQNHKKKIFFYFFSHFFIFITLYVICFGFLFRGISVRVNGLVPQGIITTYSVFVFLINGLITLPTINSLDKSELYMKYDLSSPIKRVYPQYLKYPKIKIAIIFISTFAFIMGTLMEIAMRRNFILWGGSVWLVSLIIWILTRSWKHFFSEKDFKEEIGGHELMIKQMNPILFVLLHIILMVFSFFYFIFQLAFSGR